MSYGGKVLVLLQDGRWQITGSAHKLRIEAGLWEILVDPKANFAVVPAQVQFPLVAEELAHGALRLTTELTATEIRLTF